MNRKKLRDSSMNQDIVSKIMSYDVCKTSSTINLMKPVRTKSKKCLKVQKLLAYNEVNVKNRIGSSKSLTTSHVATRVIEKPSNTKIQLSEDVIKNAAANQYAVIDLEKKFKVCASGDTIVIEDPGLAKSNHNINESKDNATRDVKQENTQPELSCNQSIDSITDSGCKTYSHSSESQNRLVAENLNVINILPEDETKKYDLEDLKMCIRDARDLKPDFDGEAWYRIDKITDNLRDIFMEILESNSQVTKLVQGLPDQYREKKANEGTIVDEIKRTIEKEIKIETQLNNFLKLHNQPQKTECANACPYDFKHLDETINAVKDSLLSIKAEINEFKVNCWDKIESKASKNEMLEMDNRLKVKIANLEAKMSAENMKIRKDFHDYKEKRKKQNSFGVKNFPVWPFVAFLGAYTIMCYGNKS